MKEVSLRSAITVRAMEHKGEKGEPEWQQMTHHSQLLNNV